MLEVVLITVYLFGKKSKQMKPTVKPVLSGHSKLDKTTILMTNGSLLKVESIAECSPWSILQCLWPALSDKNQFLLFLRVAVLYRFYCIYCYSWATIQNIYSIVLTLQEENTITTSIISYPGRTNITIKTLNPKFEPDQHAHTLYLLMT